MGFSTPVAASIVFIGILAFISSVFGLLINTMHTLVEVTSHIYDRDSGYTRIEISNITVSNDTIEILVKNLGPRTIHLIEHGYSWCSLIISYNSTLGWVTFLIDNYTVSNITVLGTNVTYSPSTHSFINPGEGAWIIARIPEGAPEIPNSSPVIVVFSTRFGEAATYEVIRGA